MEKEKNNKWLIALLITIIIILLVIVATITMKPSIFKNLTTKTNDTKTENQEETSNLPEWVNYLLSQNITEITYETGIAIDEDNDLGNCEKAIKMTKDQLKDILTKMTAGKLRKFDAGGFGGPCWSGIKVKYNGQEMNILSGKYILYGDNNKEILSLIEKEQFTLENTTMPDPVWTFEYSWDPSYINTVLNIKNNSETSTLPEWANYLLKQNITEITYETGIPIEEGNDAGKCPNPITMTKDQLKNVLTKMTVGKLKKFDLGGAGGPCWKGITIKYDNKTFKLHNGKWISYDDSDKKILSLLEKEQFTFEDTTMSDPVWIFEYNWDPSYIDTIVK